MNADQAYLHTRISAMAVRLLTPATIEQFARLGLPALAERLDLSALLDAQTSVRGRSRALEQGLIQTLFAELRILIRPLRDAERALLLAWSRKYALYNLKALIRGKLYALDANEIREQLYELPELIRLPDQELFRAENVLELLRQLEAGPNRAIARQAREAYEQQRDPFALEAVIDQRYYAGLLRRVGELPEQPHQGPLRQLLGAELDRVDLLWLLRFRFSFHLSPSETFYQLIPSPGRLSRERLLRLVNLDSTERVLESLPEPLNRLMHETRGIIDAQRRLDQYTLHAAHTLLERSPSALTRALAYLLLREADLRRLFSILQGHLLELPASSIDSALDLTAVDCGLASAQVAHGGTAP